MVSIFQFDSSHLIRFNFISFIIQFLHLCLKDYCHSIYTFSNFQHISILLPAEESCGIGQCLFDYIDYYMTLEFFFNLLRTVVIYFWFLKSTGMCSLTFKKNVQIINRIVFGDKISPVIVHHQFESHCLRHHGYGWET